MTAILGVSPPPTYLVVPWRIHQTKAQFLEVDNRYLLSALWDAAFDQGLVTFSDEGTPVFSSALSEAARQELRWGAGLTLTDRQRENLAWHRVHAFRSDAAATQKQTPTNSVN